MLFRSLPCSELLDLQLRVMARLELRKVLQLAGLVSLLLELVLELVELQDEQQAVERNFLQQQARGLLVECSPVELGPALLVVVSWERAEHQVHFLPRH